MPADENSSTVLSEMRFRASAPEGRGELREGQVLGVYQLERLLGEGSMGRVFQARHTRLGRQVALKALRPAHALDNAFVQRFFREAQAVNQINHEHIVEIFDFVEDREAGHVYCVMELLRGESLASVLRQGPLPLERIQRIGVQLCAALDAAHQVGVVHRDIKPDNIFIAERPGQPDFVKVLDFGVAKLLTSEGTGGTLDGTIVGTPTYMSPEQAAGLPVDVRADIYAVGNLLYELLTGRPPFSSPAFGQLVVQIITQQPAPLPDRLASGEPMPPGLARTVLRCLAKEPEVRPQRLAEVTTALLLLDDVPQGSLRSLELARWQARWAQVPRTRRRAVLAGVVAGVLALAGGVAASRGTPEQAASAALAAPEAVSVVAPAPASPAALPDTVLVTVKSYPEGAHVVRADTGEKLGTTPLEARVSASHEQLALRVVLDGYVPLERSVRLDANALLEVPLVKARPSAAPTRTRTPASRAVKTELGMRDGLMDPFATSH